MNKATATKEEAYPLVWPGGWIRTRIQDRKSQPAWKKRAREYREALIQELERMGAVSVVLSTNVPLNIRGELTVGIEPRDPGVAVWFSRRTKEDYSWQEVLGIHNPAPTVDEIDARYRELVMTYHPDRGGDTEMFKVLTEAREKAKAWINMRDGNSRPYVIACDQFKEVRLNICSIRLTIAAIRQIERCGTSVLLERAWKGFAALPEHAGREAHGDTSVA